jgi:hypothetical protein
MSIYKEFKKRLKLIDSKYSEQEFLTFLENCVLEWSTEDCRKIDIVMKIIDSKFYNLNIEVPKIIFVKTNGKDEWNSAYTRMNCIFLPVNKLKNSVEKLIRLIIHEIFYIISRKDSLLRDKL